MSVLSRVQRGFGYGALAVATFGIIASGVVDTPVNPTAGTVTITGYAPTVDRTQSVEPIAGTVTLTGYAPSITQSSGSAVAVSPGAGVISLIGYSPAVTQTGTLPYDPVIHVAGGGGAGNGQPYDWRNINDLFKTETNLHKQLMQEDEEVLGVIMNALMEDLI